MTGKYLWDELPPMSTCRVFHVNLETGETGIYTMDARNVTEHLASLKSHIPNVVWAVYRFLPMSMRLHADVGLKLIDYTGDWFKNEYFMMFDELKDEDES